MSTGVQARGGTSPTGSIATRGVRASSNYDRRTGVSSTTFLPTDIASQVAWYRKGIGQTIATGVSNWANQFSTGSTYDVAQAVGANQPLVQGDSSLLFDGSNDTLASASFTALTKPFTLCVRMKQVTWVSAKAITDGGAPEGLNLSQDVSSPNIGQYAGGAGATNDNGNLAVGTWGTVISIFNGASSSLQVNSGTPVSGGDPGSATITQVNLGATFVPNGYSNVQLSEVILYNKVLTAQEITNVVAYLATVGP